MSLGPMPSMQRLGSLIFTANATSVGPITIPACKFLMIVHVITGYTGADIAMFQFNGDTTVTNYGSWFMTNSNAATPINAQSANNAGTVAGIPVSGTTQTVGRVGRFFVSNIATSRKVFEISNANESTTTTGPARDGGWGEWLNTTAQITSVTMKLVGAQSLLAGTGAIIYGDNY